MKVIHPLLYRCISSSSRTIDISLNFMHQFYSRVSLESHGDNGLEMWSYCVKGELLV